MGRRLRVFACLMLVAHAARAERLPIKSYTTANGLAHVRVTRIVSDSRGFIWFCAPEGLSRFDGQGFASYGYAHGLANTRINDFLETSRGAYWVATNGGGVYRYTPLVDVGGRRNGSRTEAASRFTLFRVGDDVPTNRVNALHEDRQGRLWAGTDGGLFRLDEVVSPPAFRRVAARSSRRAALPPRWPIMESPRNLRAGLLSFRCEGRSGSRAVAGVRPPRSQTKKAVTSCGPCHRT